MTPRGGPRRLPWSEGGRARGGRARALAAEGRGGGLYNCEMIHSPEGEKADIGRNEVVVKTGSGDWLPRRSLVELEPPTMSMGLLWKIVCYSGRGR